MVSIEEVFIKLGLKCKYNFIPVALGKYDTIKLGQFLPVLTRHTLKKIKNRGEISTTFYRLMVIFIP
jgi:hypothetical protein